jgi:hypothetical protein
MQALLILFRFGRSFCDFLLIKINQLPAAIEESRGPGNLNGENTNGRADDRRNYNLNPPHHPSENPQPPNAAPSAMIPRIRILVVPRPAGIQAQPEVEGKGERAKAAREGLADHRGNVRLEANLGGPPVPAYLVRLIKNRDLVGFFAADDLDDLAVEVDDVEACEYVELPPGGIMWTGPAIAVPVAARDDGDAPAHQGYCRVARYPDDEIRPVLSLRHRHIGGFATKYSVNLEWLLEGRGHIFKTDPIRLSPNMTGSEFAAVVATMPEADQQATRGHDS